MAAEALPGGALDVTISGFVRFLAAGGELEDARNISPQFRNFNNYDFRNDTEVHILLRGVHDATGIEYGGTIEFEADTRTNDNDRSTDETWIFTRGGWGELRFGDTDSAATNMRLGGYTVAVGTGGVDGTIVFINPPVETEFRGNEDATKIVYYSPTLGGAQLGISYAPNNDDQGDQLANKDEDAEDVVTAGLAWTGLFGDVGIRSSVVGWFDLGEEDGWGTNLGAVVSFGGFSVAGNVLYFDENYDTERERVAYSLGAAYTIDRYAFSLNYGRGVTEFDTLPAGVTDDKDYVSDFVVGAEVGLLPGLVASLEVAWLDIDLGPQPSGRNDDGSGGIVGVARLALSF